MARDLNIITSRRGQIRRQWALADNQVAMPCCATVMRVPRFSNVPTEKTCPSCGETWAAVAADRGGPAPQDAIRQYRYLLWRTGPPDRQLSLIG